jgi:hypothetical protein
MLRHPFFGVIGPTSEGIDPHSFDNSDQAADVDASPRATRRRTFFGQALAGLAGAGALLLSRRTEAQSGGSFNPGGAAGGSFDKGFSGQSGGSFRGGLGGSSFGDPGPRYNGGGGGTVTTYAIGEEGSGGGGGGGSVTTFALGEEGSGGPTTRALGEEGGSRPPSGGVTTYALGEEGSSRPPYYHYRPNRPRYTTYALGEEGGRPRW